MLGTFLKPLPYKEFNRLLSRVQNIETKVLGDGEYMLSANGFDFDFYCRALDALHLLEKIDEKFTKEFLSPNVSPIK